MTSIPTQVSQTDMDPNHISPTYIGTRPIISSCRRSSLLQSWKSIPTDLIHNQISATYVKYPLIFVRYQAPLFSYSKAPPDFPTDAAATWLILNQRRGSLKYCQPTPGFLNPAPWSLQGRLKYWLPAFPWHTSWEHWPFLPSKYCLYHFLLLRVLRTLCTLNNRYRLLLTFMCSYSN